MSNIETASEQSARVALEKKLAQRPDKQELIDQNILPGTYFLPRNLSGERQHGDRRSHFIQASNIAPALQAAQRELERSRLEVCMHNVEELLVPPIDGHRPSPRTHSMRSSRAARLLSNS